ncbi:MAG: PIN/TRAM domain-containing protein [bacterium]
MLLWLVRVLFILGSASAVFYLVFQQYHTLDIAFISGGVALVFVAIIIGIEFLLRRARIKQLTVGVFGLLAGLISANLLAYALSSLFTDRFLLPLIQILLNLGLGYLGFALGIKKAENISWEDAGIVVTRPGAEQSKKILDTSSIIDGRIADISATKFLEGKFIIPRFVLKELQHIADSPDPMKRKRGRRGLDILNRLQKGDLEVEIVEQDFPDIAEVDHKLVELAKAMQGCIITNDYNLNKVAELQGITVLNINELANALKPVVLPGEELKVFVLREGKEYNQGVGYLDDGTMVVIDSGREYINQKVDVTVTSVLQTPAGRMVFAKISGLAE